MIGFFRKSKESVEPEAPGTLKINLRGFQQFPKESVSDTPGSSEMPPRVSAAEIGCSAASQTALIPDRIWMCRLCETINKPRVCRCAACDTLAYSI